METKPCILCGKEMQKLPSMSRKYWYLRKYCSSRCFGVHVKPAKKLIGTKRPAEVIKKLESTMFKKGIPSPRRGKPSIYKGERHHNWKGGVTPLNEFLRKTGEYREWRRKVFERDDYTCQICFQRGGDMHADHIKPWSRFPELRTKIENGRTLCVDCHRQTDTYGGKLLYSK